MRRIEGFKCLFLLLAASSEPGHVENRVDLKIQRGGSLGNEVIFINLIREMNAIEILLEEIDHRSATEFNITFGERAFELDVHFLEKYGQVDFGVVATGDGIVEPGELEEEKSLRKRKILLEQTIALKSGGTVRQQRLVVLKAVVADRAGGEKLDPRRGSGFGMSHDCDGMRHKLLVDSHRNPVAASNVKHEVVNRETSNCQASRGPKS